MHHVFGIGLIYVFISFMASLFVLPSAILLYVHRERKFHVTERIKALIGNFIAYNIVNFNYKRASQEKLMIREIEESHIHMLKEKNS